ncbi:hypothetical protein E2C01_055989 [Portunus trituberculatus]|uniref:Uncharacterized protein n=1 Tax=Portunus trituberculatus TaxID=210409 RepID=A0A5B7GSW5_PORTR|nr:hypothetical protein [Portunus trituberculatus]
MRGTESFFVLMLGLHIVFWMIPSYAVPIQGILVIRTFEVRIIANLDLVN